MDIPSSKEEFVNHLENNPWYRGAVVAIGLPVYAITEVIVAGAGLSATAIYLLSIAMFYISVVDSRSRKLVRMVGDLNSEQDVGRILKWEPEVKNQFDEIKEQSFGHGIFVEYSGVKADHMWNQLLRNGDDIYLLLKKPSAAIDANDGETQKERIEGTITHRLYDQRARSSQINVIFYDYSASVRARRLGDEHLYLGWYSYDETGEGDTVWGHSNPMVYVTEDHPKFDDLDDFFMGNALSRLWKSGTTPAKLLEEDSPEWLKNWVESGNQDQRREFLDAISPKAELDAELDIEIEDLDQVRGARTYTK